MHDGAHLSVRIILRRVFAGVDLAAICRERRGVGASDARGASHVVLEESRARENECLLELDGQIPDELTAGIARELWRALSRSERERFDSIGTFVEGDVVRRSNSLALTQLLITVLLLHSSAESREQAPAPSLTL
jgi:hypothetical protein